MTGTESLHSCLRRLAFRHVYNRRLGWRVIQRALPKVEADW